MKDESEDEDEVRWKQRKKAKNTFVHTYRVPHSVGVAVAAI